MPVCKYFLEGRCRYGNNCRFEHSRGGPRNLFGDDNWQRRGEGQQRVTFHDSFNSGVQNDNKYKWSADSQQNQGIAAQQSTLDVVSSFPKDIEILETSKMWPLTCIGLEGNSPSIPDFYDISFEELRLDAYQAIKSGNISPYIEKYNQLLRDFANKRNQLKHLTMETKKKWMTFLDNTRRGVSQGSGTPASTVNPIQSPSSLFSQANANSSFGASSGLFGASSGLFGKQNSGSVVNSSPGGTSLFGEAPFGTSSPARPTFGSMDPNSMPFGKPAPTVGQSFASTPMTLFGKPVAPASGEPSIASSSIFAATLPQKSSIFGPGPPQPHNASIFAPGPSQPHIASIFAPGQSQPNIASIFAPGQSQPNNTSIFAPGPSQSNIASIFAPGPSQSNTANIFAPGPSQSSTANIFAPGPSQSNTASIFSPGQSQQSATAFGSSTGFASAPSSGLQFGQPALAVNPPPKPAMTMSQPTTSGLYTPLASLNDQEKEAFTAKSFLLGKIPLRPPPVEMIT